MAVSQAVCRPGFTRTLVLLVVLAVCVLAKEVSADARNASGISLFDNRKGRALLQTQTCPDLLNARMDGCGDAERGVDWWTEEKKQEAKSKLSRKKFKKLRKKMKKLKKQAERTSQWMSSGVPTDLSTKYAEKCECVEELAGKADKCAGKQSAKCKDIRKQYKRCKKNRDEIVTKYVRKCTRQKNAAQALALESDLGDPLFTTTTTSTTTSTTSTTSTTTSTTSSTTSTTSTSTTSAPCVCTENLSAPNYVNCVKQLASFKNELPVGTTSASFPCLTDVIGNFGVRNFGHIFFFLYKLGTCT